MRILILDPNELNQESAWLTLGKEHSLTVVGSFGEAYKQLVLDIPYRQFNQFEVVMSDPLFEAEDKEMPAGIQLTLLAIGLGIKKVAVVTDDANHFELTGLNCLHALFCKRGTHFIYENRAPNIRLDDQGELADPLTMSQGTDFDGEPKGFLIGGKDWASVLKKLLHSKS